ncbi:MAG TPA: M1 family metallopeptidase [Cyclobacteriaceae bacterium]|nr:M1 family metallopeptidase [Cyclobacteriaceae bacterium]
MKRIIVIILLAGSMATSAQDKNWQGKFEQLGETLPTPNSYRTASGAPGNAYWQQRADYVIDVEVNDETQVLTGKETVTYFNNSPEALTYLWLQLDQNLLAKNSIALQTKRGLVRDSLPGLSVSNVLGIQTDDYQGGYNIKSVKDAAGNNLPYVINNTMMRIDLPKPLKNGENFVFSVEWSYHEYDRQRYDERGGYEFFPEDGNYVYTFAQWFPRMCVFDDYEGWQNKQFLGQGEFTLTFGNYKVRITVPSDHIVSATGWLQNPKTVLTKQQQERFAQAQKTFDKQVFIVTEDEARKKEKERSKKKSTWEFSAENVRDFAFASSRKFIWDAQAVKTGEKNTLAQSLYPKEGNPLWANESTKAIKNALEIYSARTFEYPYPTAISVHMANQGMEYPMICFNGERPDKNGKFSQQTLIGLVSVVVHEVGHNYFPMIVNSDERQWSWMDEGLNTFLEKETIQNRYKELNYSWGTPKSVSNFMKGDKSQMRPIMSSSDNIREREFGMNAYGKPSAALTVLRETVMGPELFDKAFKEYAQRWMFKHPKPADFFRTMEDASGVDLDWFWRGWFYGTEHVDVDLAEVKWYTLKTPSSTLEGKNAKAKTGDLNASKGNANDFSGGPQPFTVLNSPPAASEFRSIFDDNAARKQLEGKNLYEIKFKNTGGLITPLIIQWVYKDGSSETETIPAEIWRKDEREVTKVFIKEKEVVNILLDPNFGSADVNMNNNVFPKRATESKFDQFKKVN